MACHKLAIVSHTTRHWQELRKQTNAICYHWLLPIHHASGIVCIIAKSLQVVMLLAVAPELAFSHTRTTTYLGIIVLMT